jgi:nicotinate-nucleotide adenylyltransferase
MNAGARLGILGGTLDPVHLGHIETGLAAREALALDRLLLLPSRVPPHRPQQPFASPFHRFAMAALAVNGMDGFEASDIELRLPGPSYTAETLDRFGRSGLRPSQLFIIIGADAFAEIESWKRYPEVLDLANFVVVSRPGFESERLAVGVPALASRVALPSGAGTRAGETTRIFLLTAQTPDISSTDIRRRLQVGEPIAGLVPDTVERHIRQHGLYVNSDPILVTHTSADHLHGED